MLKISPMGQRVSPGCPSPDIIYQFAVGEWAILHAFLADLRDDQGRAAAADGRN
jgi:hypothetical protein